MTIDEFVMDNLGTLIPQYLSNARFTLLETVIRALTPPPERELDVALQVATKLSQLIEAEPTKYLPRKCCATCWGPCGRLCQTLADGFCDPSGNPYGTSCERFSPKEDFGKRPIVLERTNKRRGGGSYTQQESLQIEQGVVRIRRTTRNNNTGRVLKSRSFDKIFVGDTDKFVRRFLRIMRKSLTAEMILNGYRTTITPEERTVQHGVPLKKGETLDQYLSRVTEEVHKMLETTSKESYDMPYDKAVEFVKSQLTAEEKRVLEDCRNFEEFLSLAFPFMSIWQVVESLKQEPLLN